MLCLPHRTIALDVYVSPAGDDAGSGAATSPFRTLERAKIAVRAAQPLRADLAVILRGGWYSLAKTLELGPQDGGSNGFLVRYRAFAGERAILSGGARLTGWQRQPGSGNLWKTTFPAGPVPRQFFVDSLRAVRARSEGPLMGETLDAQGELTLDASMAAWPDIRGMEMVYEQGWTSPRCLVQSASLEGGKTRLSMSQPGWANLMGQGNAATRIGLSWYYENAFALLDQPGEWYANRATHEFFYIPRPGEDLSKAMAVVPMLDRLIAVTGAHDLEFQGLVFAHAAWPFLDSAGFLRDAQSNINRTPVRGNPAPQRLSNASVTVTGKRIAFERCDFTQSGGAGLNLEAPIGDVTIRGCRFFRLSGSGIQIGDPENGSAAATNIKIQDNYIHHIGEEYRSSVAVFAAFPELLEISHNELAFLPYSGITVGWNWGNGPTAAKNNLFRANYIHDIVRELRDAAGIYTLGAQPATVWENNFVERVVNDYGCFYPDQGSRGHTIRNNVCSQAKQWLHLWTTSITGNTVTGNFSDSRGFLNQGVNNIVTNNSISDPGSWPSAARIVIARAGLEAAYRDLLSARDPLPGSDAIGRTGRSGNAGMRVDYKHGYLRMDPGLGTVSVRLIDADGRVLAASGFAEKANGGSSVAFPGPGFRPARGRHFLQVQSAQGTAVLAVPDFP